MTGPLDTRNLRRSPAASALWPACTALLVVLGSAAHADTQRWYAPRPPNDAEGYHWPPAVTGVTTESAAVVWLQRHDAGDAGKLEYGTASKYGTTVTDIQVTPAVQAKSEEASMPLRLCRARLKGLKPGTTYYYRVTGKDMAEFKSQFRTNQGTKQEVVRLIVYGDWYFMVDEDAAFAEEFLGGPVDAVLHCGDHVLRGSYHTWQSRLPRYVATGNHDDVRQLDGYYDFPDEGNGPGNFTVERGNTLLVLIKSTNHYSQFIDDYTKAFIARELATSRSLWKLVFYHGDVYSGGHHGIHGHGARNRKDFAEILATGRADFVFHGHDHYNGRTYPLVYDGKRDDARGTHYVIAGGAGGPFIMLHDWYANQPVGTNAPDRFNRTGAHGFYLVKVRETRLELAFVEPVRAKRQKTRFLIRDRLLVVKDPAYVAGLMRDLKGFDAKKRDGAAEELGLLQHLPAAPRIKGLLALAKGTESKARYLEALARIGDPATAGAALPFIADADEDVRYVAVDFIARMGDAALVRKLAGRLDEEKSVRVRPRLIDGVMRCGKDAELGKVLVGLLRQCPPYHRKKFNHVRAAIFFHKTDAAVPVICERLVETAKAAKKPISSHSAEGEHIARTCRSLSPGSRNTFSFAVPKYRREILSMLDALMGLEGGYRNPSGNPRHDLMNTLRQCREAVSAAR